MFSLTSYGKSKSFDWTKLINAIAQVESEGNPSAKCGNSVGLLQITPVCVADCNEFLKMKGSKKRYKLSDRLSPEKSKEMFILIQERYNPNNNVEYAIRSWNGGPRYSTSKTAKYYNKVMKHYKKQK